MSTERINVFSILSSVLLPVLIVSPVQLPVQHRRQFTCAQVLTLFKHPKKLNNLAEKTPGNSAGTDSRTLFACTDVKKHPPTKKEEEETLPVRTS